MTVEKKFLAVLVVAIVTIGQSFSFTLPTTSSVPKIYRTSSVYRSASLLSSSSALGMATWSNGETK